MKKHEHVVKKFNKLFGVGWTKMKAKVTSMKVVRRMSVFKAFS